MIRLILREYQAGATVQALSERHGLTREQVRALLRAEGINLRVGQPASVDQGARARRDSTIAELYRAGRSCREIGWALGIPPGTVHRALVRLGVPRRPVGQPPSE